MASSLRVLIGNGQAGLSWPLRVRLRVATLCILLLVEVVSYRPVSLARRSWPQRVRLLSVADEAGDAAGLGGAGRLGRRTMQVDFSCKACGSRTTRMINPEAYRTGVVIVQCASCRKHHGEQPHVQSCPRCFALCAPKYAARP